MGQGNLETDVVIQTNYLYTRENLEGRQPNTLEEKWKNRREEELRRASWFDE